MPFLVGNSKNHGRSQGELRWKYKVFACYKFSSMRLSQLFEKRRYLPSASLTQ